MPPNLKGYGPWQAHHDLVHLCDTGFCGSFSLLFIFCSSLKTLNTMATEYLLSLGGWAFLPNLVTGWAQSFYYGITIRAGEPHPQPGTPLFQKHRRNIFTLVIVGYLLFTIYQTDWQIQRESDFYTLLDIAFDADEKTISRQLRKQLALAHPDKAPASQRDFAEAKFIRVKIAYDTLSDPVKRFAYDRFGPDMLNWKTCKTMQDYVVRGAQNSGVAVLSALVVILIAQAFGQMQYGKYVSSNAFLGHKMDI